MKAPRFSWWQIQAKRCWSEAQTVYYLEAHGHDPYKFGCSPEKWERSLWFRLETWIAKLLRGGSVALKEKGDDGE